LVSKGTRGILENFPVAFGAFLGAAGVDGVVVVVLLVAFFWFNAK
jgi:hypothetical protein